MTLKEVKEELLNETKLAKYESFRKELKYLIVTVVDDSEVGLHDARRFQRIGELMRCIVFAYDDLREYGVIEKDESVENLRNWAYGET